MKTPRLKTIFAAMTIASGFLLSGCDSEKVKGTICEVTVDGTTATVTETFLGRTILTATGLYPDLDGNLRTRNVESSKPIKNPYFKVDPHKGICVVGSGVKILGGQYAYPLKVDTDKPPHPQPPSS